MPGGEHGNGTEGEVLEHPGTEEQTAEPELWNVYLLNDDYTTMDFVVEILESVFLKSPSEAHGIMMRVHTQGKGLAGVYPYEVAETKVATTRELAESACFPLQATFEPA